MLIGPHRHVVWHWMDEGPSQYNPFRLHIKSAKHELQHGGSGQVSADATVAVAAAAAHGHGKGRRVLKPRSTLTDEILRLQQQVCDCQREVDALWEQRHILRARNLASQLCVDQCLALFRLGEHLQQNSGGAAPQAGEPEHPVHKWTTHLQQTQQQLEVAVEGTSPAQGNRELGWSPDAAAAIAPTADLSTRGLRRALKEFNQTCGLHYLKARPGSGCPDTHEALLQLAQARARLLELSSVICLSDDPRAPSEVMLSSLDEDDTSGKAPPSSPDWMMWLVEQLDLDAEQEEVVFATLASLAERQAPILQQRAALIAQAGACSHLPEELEELLPHINACLNTYQIIVCVHMLAVYGSILRADQFAAFFLSAWPFMPSLSGLRQALKTIREQGQTEQQAAAAAANLQDATQAAGLADGTQTGGRSRGTQ